MEIVFVIIALPGSGHGDGLQEFLEVSQVIVDVPEVGETGGVGHVGGGGGELPAGKLRAEEESPAGPGSLHVLNFGLTFLLQATSSSSRSQSDHVVKYWLGNFLTLVRADKPRPLFNRQPEGDLDQGLSYPSERVF